MNFLSNAFSLCCNFSVPLDSLYVDLHWLLFCQCIPSWNCRAKVGNICWKFYDDALMENVGFLFCNYLKLILYMLILKFGDVTFRFHFCRLKTESHEKGHARISWTYWFNKLLYHQVALVYVLTRLVTNVSQVRITVYQCCFARLFHRDYLNRQTHLYLYLFVCFYFFL